MNLPSKSEILIKLVTDYKNFRNYLPEQIRSITIIEKTENSTTTEEILTFKSLITTEIKQRTIHKKDASTINSKIISGPFKNSIIEVNFEDINSGSYVKIIANLKIPVKYKIFSLVIKKFYKIFLTGILYKINANAQKLS